MRLFTPARSLDESQTAELLAYRERAYAKLPQLCAELGPAPGFK